MFDLSQNRDTGERKQDDALRTIYEMQTLDHVFKDQVEIALTTEYWTGLFYLPRHVVKKERRGKIKWRIVLDASFNECISLSLNDVFEMGLNILPEVLAALLRFR